MRSTNKSLAARTTGKDQTRHEWIARNISYLLRRQGINARQLSIKTGLDPKTITALRSGGRHSPTIRTLGRVAEVLGVDLAEIITAPFDMGEKIEELLEVGAVNAEDIE